MQVLIVASGARVYYEMLRFIKCFLSRNPNPRLCASLSRLKIMLGRPNDTPRTVKILQLRAKSEILRVFFKALCATMNKEEFKQVIMGIDPGMRIGMIILGDGEILDAITFREVSKLADYIREIIESCPAHEFTIKIGDGAHYEEILDALTKIMESNDSQYKLAITVVSERKATRRNIPRCMAWWIKDKDLLAALQIALEPTLTLKI